MHRFRLSITLPFLAALSFFVSTTAWEEPAFCRHKIECPPFTVVKQTEDYELRRYGLCSDDGECTSAKWASTIIKGDSFVDAQGEGFERLFSYISGQNEQKAKIPMTAPVRTRIEPGDGPFCYTKFTVAFLVPSEYSDNPPAAKSSEIFIEEDPEDFEVYVTSYGGYMDESNVVDHAQTLISILEKEGIEVESAVYYAAGYDSPFELFNRHNEIWVFPKKEAT